MIKPNKLYQLKEYLRVTRKRESAYEGHVLHGSIDVSMAQNERANVMVWLI